MNTLDAVNDILRRCGYTVVPALDTGGNSLQAQAERQLDDADIRIQSLGWHWNRRRLTLSPDEDGEIVVADAIETPRGPLLEIDAAGVSLRNHVEVSLRDGKLFRLPDMEATFDSDLEVEVVERLPLVEVPIMFAAWMIAEAAFDLNQRYLDDREATAALASERAIARVNAMRQAIRIADVNVLDADDVRSVHGRRRMPHWSVVQ